MSDKKHFCPNCNAFVTVTVQSEIERFTVKGEEIETKSMIAHCDICGQHVWDNELDNQNTINVYNIYRQNHGLLMPQDIKRIREKYNATQIAFARILGMGDKTITRYENGSLQDEAQNNLILLADNPQNFSVLLEKNRSHISELEYARIRSSFIAATMTASFKPSGIYRFGVNTQGYSLWNTIITVDDGGTNNAC